jgi:hypothetical protein
VLEEKLRLGQFGMEVAKSYAHAILYQNAREFYRLPACEGEADMGLQKVHTQ